MAFILTSWCKAHKREVGTNATDGVTKAQLISEAVFLGFKSP